MTAAQKRILILLALADLLVIGGLGWTVWRTMQRPAPPPLATVPTDCPQHLLAALPTRLSPAVSWEGTRLLVQMTAYYGTEQPPETAAQLLWTGLDGVKAAVEAGCALPPQVVVHVTAIGQKGRAGYEAALRGADVLAWAEGRLNDGELAARARYLRFTEAVPAPPTASPSPAPRR